MFDFVNKSLEYQKKTTCAECLKTVVSRICLFVTIKYKIMDVYLKSLAYCYEFLYYKVHFQDNVTATQNINQNLSLAMAGLTFKTCRKKDWYVLPIIKTHLCLYGVHF